MIRATAHPSRPFLPLLVTGSAGVAGYNAFRYFRSRYGDQVVGMRRADNRRLSGEGIVACNGYDSQQLRRLFDKRQFAAVLNCEGSCNLKSCEMDPALAMRINVDSVETILDAIGSADVRLVHLSVDLVFSGTRGGGHVEEDATDPVTVYGQTMVRAEQMVARRKPDACVLRISLPMGVSFNGHAGAIDWIQHRFQQNKRATLFFDEIRTPTYTDCLNPLFHDMLAARHAGLYHAGGPRPLSLYQIAQIVNRVGGYDPRHVHGCLREQAGPLPPRAGNVTMNSDKLARALGYESFAPWPLDERYVPTHRDWHCERSPDESGSAELLAQVLYRRPAR